MSQELSHKGRCGARGRDRGAVPASTFRMGVADHLYGLVVPYRDVTVTVRAGLVCVTHDSGDDSGDDGRVDKTT